MLLFILMILWPFSSPADEPFWRAKEKVYQRIQNREVIVSVSSRDESEVGHRLVIRGGGQVNAPCTEVRKSAQNYEPMAKASGYLDDAKFNAETSILEGHIRAYGLKSKVEIKLQTLNPEIGYEILTGPLKGMSGRFQFFEAGKKCDVGMTGDFTYEKFPVPQFFLRFGMEVMLQRMAGKIRAFAEEQHGHP